MSTQHTQQTKDYTSAPTVSNGGFEYLGIPSSHSDLRYTESNSSIPLESANNFPLFTSPALPNTSIYQQSGNLYQPASFPVVDITQRLASHAAVPGTMAPRTNIRGSAANYYDGQSQPIKETYSGYLPLGKKSPHNARGMDYHSTLPRSAKLSTSPSAHGLCTPNSHRVTPSPCDNLAGGDQPMPMQATKMLGTLAYDGKAWASVEIQASLHKNFFQADGEWTCYRRNYMSCTCSFSMEHFVPGCYITFTPHDSSRMVEIISFAMSISAIVSGNEQQTIQLDLYTPKRDPKKTLKAGRVNMHPLQASMHDGQLITEHTFERVQFRQATQNNGKRRAAQQFYHFVVELWARVRRDTASEAEWIKVAIQMSEKMIVRGRSPGHYQNDKSRQQALGHSGHTSSGTSFGGFGSIPGALSDFGGPGLLGDGSHGYAYDGRSAMYHSDRHHDAEMFHDTGSKSFLTYPTFPYDSNDRVDMFPQTSNILPHIDVYGKPKQERNNMFEVGSMATGSQARSGATRSSTLDSHAMFGTTDTHDRRDYH